MGLPWGPKGSLWGPMGPSGLPLSSHGTPMGAPRGPMGPRDPKPSFSSDLAPHFPAKCVKIIELSSILWPHGVLKRIYRIQRKRNILGRTDPGFPTPGVRITVVYTNSFKLISISYDMVLH